MKLIARLVVLSIALTFVVCLLSKWIIEDYSYPMESEYGFHNKPYSRFVKSDEGYAIIKMDKYGFNNDVDLKFDDHLFLFMGDSITEATQVARKNNFVDLVSKQVKGNYTMYNIGFSGNSMADYLALYPKVKQHFKPEHTFIVVQLNDFTTDTTSSDKRNYIVKDDNGYKIVSNTLEEMKTSSSVERILIEKFHYFLPFAKHIKKKIIGILQECVSYADARSIKSENEVYSRIDWILNEVKAVSDDVTLVYISDIPFIRNGEIEYSSVSYPAEMKEYLFEICGQSGINILDTESAFIDMYVKDKNMPRGFNNTAPGEGHLNNNGHKAVANEIIEYFNNYLRETGI